MGSREVSPEPRNGFKRWKGFVVEIPEENTDPARPVRFWERRLKCIRQRASATKAII